MAKRSASRRSKPMRSARKAAKARRSGRRPDKKIARQAKTPKKTPRLNRPRRTLPDVVPTPPSSLNLNRHVQYQDNEELKSADKVVEPDKHGWELDPASAEDYKERK